MSDGEGEDEDDENEDWDETELVSHKGKTLRYLVQFILIYVTHHEILVRQRTFN